MKKVFFVAALAAGLLGLAGCKSTYLVNDGATFVPNHEFKVLGRVTVQTNDKENDKHLGYNYLMDKAIKDYPHADAVIHVMVDAVGDEDSKYYVISGLAIDYDPDEAWYVAEAERIAAEEAEKARLEAERQAKIEAEKQAKLEKKIVKAGTKTQSQAEETAETVASEEKAAPAATEEVQTAAESSETAAAVSETPADTEAPAADVQ